MMDNFSNELLARPTYAETYWNFKLNMKEVHVPGHMEEHGEVRSEDILNQTASQIASAIVRDR